MTPQMKLINFVLAHPELAGVTTSPVPIPGQEIIGVNTKQTPVVDPIGGGTIVYQDDIITVYAFTTDAAGLYYGKGAIWCFSFENAKTMDQLAPHGPMYVVIPKNPSHSREKYAFHFPSGDYRNERMLCILDPIDAEPMYIGDKPMISSFRKMFHPLAKFYNVPDLMGSDYIKSQLDMTDAVIIDASWRKIITDIYADPVANADIIGYLQSFPNLSETAFCAEIDEFYNQIFKNVHINSKKVYVVLNPHADKTLPFYTSIINLEK
jgi:hypothetical protein